MKNEIIKFEEIEELNILQKSKAEQIKETFIKMAQMLKCYENEFEEVITKANKEGINSLIEKQAKELRLKIKKIRTEAEKIRKQEKQQFLLAGRAVDGVANILKWAVQDKEEKLKEIETYWERKEKERLEKLQQERLKKIAPYLTEEAEMLNFSTMPEDVFNTYYQKRKLDFEEKERLEKERLEKERLEAERKEKERLEAIRKQKELEKQLEAERREKERLEKERKQKELEMQRQLEAERREKERLEKERKQKELEMQRQLEAERKEKERLEAEKIEREKETEALKTDREKYKRFLSLWEEIIFIKFRSKKLQNLQIAINKANKEINQEIQKLKGSK